MSFETILTSERGATMRSQGWWKDLTINDYFTQALATHSDKPAIVASVPARM